MLASFASYKKPLTKEDEKEEFDALYQLLQSMVKPSDSSLPSQEKNEVIEPFMIKQEIEACEEESKNPNSIDSDTSEKSQSTLSIVKDENVLDNVISTSPDVFEIYNYIRPRGRPKGSKTTIEKEKKEKRKYTKKDKLQKKDDLKKEKSDEEIQPIVHPIEMPKSMKVPHPRVPMYPNGITCKCCLESFPTNTDYLLHLNTSDICMKVLIQPLYYQPRHELTKPLHMIMYDWLSSALTDGKDQLTCRHCHMSFKNIGNINKHLYISLPCNRMAYIEFKKIVSDY